MKIATVLGTRPEIIRLSLVIEKLDSLAEQVLIHTGQNYDPNLNDIFFRDLGVRAPNYYLGVQGGSFGEQVGQILARVEPVLEKERPDRVLILGDTNSGLTAFIAKRMGIPVYHMEAGNRCYDDRVPEEVNRRVIDHSSDVLMPYTERSRANLLREGIPGYRIFVTGNPILEVINHYQDRIQASTALADLGVEKGRYFLVTMHRAENVDLQPRLKSLTAALELLHREYDYPIICSLHPRTRSKMLAFGLDPQKSAVRRSICSSTATCAAPRRSACRPAPQRSRDWKPSRSTSRRPTCRMKSGRSTMKRPSRDSPIAWAGRCGR